jgi:hypothetical protein
VVEARYWAGDAPEPGPRPVDVRGLGTRRLQLRRVGAPRHRVRDRRRTLTGDLVGAGGDGGGRAREFLRGWEEFRAEPDEYREVDDERVLVLVAAAGRGKTSGLDLEQMRTAYPSSRGGASLIQVRDGKVTKVVLYTTATVSSPTSGSPRRTTRGSRRVARERRSGAPGRRGLAA